MALKTMLICFVAISNEILLTVGSLMWESTWDNKVSKLVSILSDVVKQLMFSAIKVDSLLKI